MSFTKIAAVTTQGSEQPAKIRFYYSSDDLFNKLDLKTHYRAKMITDGKGESQLDELAISQDELDWFLDTLEEAVFEMGTYMFKIARGVSNSIFFNSTLDDELEEKCSGFELVDNASYNTNILPVVDKKFQVCLLYYCLREWYGTVALPDDIQANNLLYNFHLKKLNSLTFQLRKPTM